MIREGGLAYRAADPDNLRLAYCLARRGKRDKNEVIRYEKSLDNNLLELRRQILSGKVEREEFRYFCIYEPKRRVISAVPFGQRVMHHALINVCKDRFERHLIEDSYACRKDKGTFKALEKTALNCRRYPWFLKMDVRKYFDSINHDYLKNKLSRLFKDRVLLSLFDDIIDVYETEEGCGLPIGNLTSQYFANHYLSAADHYIRERLGALAYVRYMDDMIVWGKSATELNRIGEAFENFLQNDGGLSLKIRMLNRTSHGLPFLGFLVYPHRIRLGRDSRRRFVRKLMSYLIALEQENMTQQEFSRRTLALYGYISHCDSRGFAASVLRAFSSAGIGL